MVKTKDLRGQRFGEWEVVDRAPDRVQTTAGGRVKRWDRWHVQCWCLESRIVEGSALRTGRTKSCGCRGADAPVLPANELLDYWRR
jgi:hypothetical protein